MNEEILGNLDFPTNNTKIYGGLLLIKGWAFSKRGNDLTIEIYLDEKLMKKGKWGLPRIDVYNSFQTEVSYESGFFGRTGLKSFEFGKHEMKIIARSKESVKLLDSVKIQLGKKEKNDPPIPRFPIAAGPPGRYKKMGKRYVDYFIKWGNLKSTDKVLEMGCGLGRLSMALKQFLKDESEYHGFDIVPEAIEYCTENITSRYPNFHFSLINIYNKLYNKNGNLSAKEFNFPFENGYLDFVFLISVFTHLTLNDMQHYLSEISRVLNIGQKCFITYFLYGNENNRNDKSKPKDHDFKYPFEGFRSIDPDVPEKAVAYDEKLIRKLYEENSLRIIEPIHYRLDDPKKSGLIQQDIIVAEKID